MLWCVTREESDGLQRFGGGEGGICRVRGKSERVSCEGWGRLQMVSREGGRGDYIVGDIILKIQELAQEMESLCLAEVIEG